MPSLKLIARSAAVLVSVAALAGCNGSFTGSGTMIGKKGTPAIIKMSVLCDPNTQTVSGSFLYTDPMAGISVRGAAVDRALISTYGGYYEPAQCDNDESEAHYVVRSKTQEVRVDVQQTPTYNGRTCTSGYAVTVAILSGKGAGYQNASCVRGTMTPITVPTSR